MLLLVPPPTQPQTFTTNMASIPKIPTIPAIPVTSDPHFTDPFDRANGGLAGTGPGSGPLWAEDTTEPALIVSNAVSGLVTQSGVPRLDTLASSTDYFSMCTVDYGTTNGAGPAGRVTTSGVAPYYFAYFIYFNSVDGKVNIYKQNAGFTLLSSSSGGLSNNAILRLEMSGTALVALHNGAVVTSTTDSALAGPGYPGMYVDIGAICNDFETNGVRV